MKKFSIFLGCTAVMLFCVCRLAAQAPGHSGMQAYDPPRKWHGLDLALFFGTFNTVTGVQALNSCTSCNQNVADGYQALYSCTSCWSNVAAGYRAGSSCTTCFINVAIGTDALMANSTGYDNVAIGSEAMSAATGGQDNVAIGGSALETSTASSSVGIGTNAIFRGESNSAAVGYNAMFTSHSPTGFNSALGAYALNGSATLAGNVGFYNVAVGAYSLYGDSSGSDNTVVGYQALYNNKSGSFNNASGMLSLYNNTTGNDNVADGLLALYSNTTGTFNTGIGMEALYSNTTGTYNTGLGFGASLGSGALTNATALGSNAVVSSSNQVVIGNTAVTSIGGYAAWTKFSDGRFKKNIQQNVPGLAFINKLNPVTYTLDVAGIESKLHRNEPVLPATAASARKSAQDDPIMKQAMLEKAAVTYTGFVAQDVEKAAESVNYVFSGVDKPKNADQSFYGLRYEDFVPPLVKAVQELSASSDRKDSLINDLQSKFDSLQAQVRELRALVPAQKSAAMSGASLDQNAPNPFTGSTVIGYSLPPGVSSAQLRISDAAGKVLATIPLSGSGRNSVTANVSGFAAGIYQYSLIVNGKLVGTKEMMSVR